MIGPHDSVPLGAAVMQVCHYITEQGRSITMIQAARMWRFVRVGGDCAVHISTASKVGSMRLLTKLVTFVNYGRDRSSEMKQTVRQRWEKALVRHGRRPARTCSAAATINEEPNDDNGPTGNKRHRSFVDREDLLADRGPISLIDKEETNICFSCDAFGMAIPCFSQIGNTLEVLGQGRPGKMTKHF